MRRGAAVVVAVRMVVAAAAVAAPTVSSAVGDVDRWAAEVEVVAPWIARVDGKVPEAVGPIERAVEVGGGAECVPLPLQEDVAHVEVAPLPVRAEHVVDGSDAHEVVEVDFVCGVILLLREVELVGHLVREEESLATCLLVAHGI